jgi:hypothetical protein
VRALEKQEVAIVHEFLSLTVEKMWKWRRSASLGNGLGDTAKHIHENQNTTISTTPNMNFIRPLQPKTGDFIKINQQ